MEEACKQPSLSYSDREEDVLSRDRSTDRILASMGLIEDAPPLFGNCEHAEWVGGFMVLAMLAESPVLTTALHVYKSLGAAFYGLRTMIVTWVLMALLRIKCNWVKELAEARVAEQEGAVKTLEIDGHIIAYSGKKKVGTVYSSRSKQVIKGQTENCVNLPSAGELFMITSISAKQMDAITIAETLFNRTGSQENYFKYMRQEFRLDATAMYDTDAIDDLELTHPNPAYGKLEKKQHKVREIRRRRLESYAVSSISNKHRYPFLSFTMFRDIGRQISNWR